MIIRDLFEKDIERSIEGVVTIGNETEEQKLQELEEYVCTDEITKCFRVFFRKYRESISTPTGKMGVWITGFFGSGKSHFLKILGYILENKEIANKLPYKYFEDKIDDKMILADIDKSSNIKNKVVIFTIPSKANSNAKNKNTAITDIMLRAFNGAIGYCGSNPWVADLERSLDSEGTLISFINKFEKLSSRDWKTTRGKALLHRDSIIKALVDVRNMTEESAKKYIDDQINNYTTSPEDFAEIVNNYCIKEKTRVIFLMDEVGQFIGDNTQLMLDLQTCVEDLGKYCHGKTWVVVTSQQELKAMLDSTKEKQHDFSKIQGRFDTRLLLSGANADEVIKRRILEKKKTAYTPLESLYETYQSKLGQLINFPTKPTWTGYSDAAQFRMVYPFVSYQFELLQKVFEAIRENGMSEGKHLSQNERSLLSAFQNSCKEYADKDTSVLIPFDSFYSTIEEFIDYDIKTVFANAERRAGLDSFSLRVLRLLFMIKHVKEMPKTVDRLASMMVENINDIKADLKTKIQEALIRLEEETLIQKNGDEYDFLTNAEQDVNKQIIKASYNEGEIQRTIHEIIFDRIFDNNKYRYDGKYDFSLNRYVDNELHGGSSKEGLTIKVFSFFSKPKSETDFCTDSINNTIVIDLTNGLFIEELIHANKIETFKRNNSSAMSVAMTEIMSKKTSEISERRKRAEDLIRESLRTAPIYLCGNVLDIKQKDGKERINDALKELIKQQYYKLPLVNYYFPDQKSIAIMLNEEKTDLIEVDITNDANYQAYLEIFELIKDDKRLIKTTTVKTIVDKFTKQPYGWRDTDIIGIIGYLWKYNLIQIYIHDNYVDDTDGKFKADLSHKVGLDTMVITQKEKIAEEVLYQVKRIMSDVYTENLPLDEDKLKNGVIGFFERKKAFIEDLKKKYGNSYAGSTISAEIYNEFSEILRNRDASAIFNTIIAKQDNLEKHASILEQLETFYKNGSSQQKNYRDAQAIVEWYSKNALLSDLTEFGDVVDKISNILAMDLPFSEMNQLSSYVFQANEIKQKIIKEKLNSVKERLENDQISVTNELNEVLEKDIPEGSKDKIKDKADAIFKQYNSWLDALNEDTTNMDAFITSSDNSLNSFRNFIAITINEDKPTVRSKRIRIINCIPVANKTITTSDDVEKVVAAIRNSLLDALKDNEELNLD
ncbi:BREX system P-loop protein BrxC [Ruminococcus flavefaciens]|uniref:BREX system P-loop protein BrxC n=1 Tax=Ruminococcus flavefaciens TaxID=1265 RepID=UPI0004637AE7|nr:BREX system P-loop protein BrxC [Ruminococcus flavefaciens]